MLQVTVTETNPIIELSLGDRAEQEKQDKTLLKKLGYHGFTKKEYEWFLVNGFYFKPYDLTPELRQEHDRELAEWRELRDRELRVRLHIELDHTLSDAEKWRDLESTYPLEPENKSAGFYKAIPILHFGDRLEREP
jgi:hypothetical protein